MSWILTALMALIALGATAALWRYHQREVRHLRSSHAEALENLDEEHHRRVKRLSRAHEEHLLTAHHPLASDLLPAIDSLDQALENLNREGVQDLESFQEGIELARKSLHTALGRHGILPIAPARGDAFDPQLHEAIARIEDPEGEAGTIAALLRAGYQHEARVLRAAMVTVFMTATAESGVEDTAGLEDPVEEDEQGEPEQEPEQEPEPEPEPEQEQEHDASSMRPSSSEKSP